MRPFRITDPHLLYIPRRRCLGACRNACCFASVAFSQGFTPLMYASKMCVSNMDLTRVLLNYGQSPGVEEQDLEEGNTPLHWAIVGGVQSPYALSPMLKVNLHMLGFLLTDW